MTRTAPDMAPPGSPCARCSILKPMMRHATLAVASTVGPPVPTTTAEPTGPTHTSSIGLSIRNRSVYTPGLISSTSNGLALPARR